MIARAIEDTREAIEEALGLIRRFEDGPMTMTVALIDIRKEVDAIEQEVEVMKDHIDELRTLVARLRAQRDFAVRQRQDAFIMMRQKSEKVTTPPAKAGGFLRRRRLQQRLLRLRLAFTAPTLAPEGSVQADWVTRTLRRFKSYVQNFSAQP
jgi:chromosome segregation ATPase